MGSSTRKNDLWQSVLTDLGDTWCEGQDWFARAAVLEYSPQEGRVRLSGCADPPRLSGNQLRTLSDAFFRVSGGRPELHVQASVADVERTVVYALDRADDTEAGAPLELVDAFTFDSFLVGPSNSLAHATGIVAATQPGVTYNPLYLSGPSGLGKTHLLHAICRLALAQGPGRRVLYVSAERFARDRNDGETAGHAASARERYRRCDLLAIDDLDQLAGHRAAQDELLHTFDALHNRHKQIVLGAACLPHEIDAFDDRLVSRMLSGLVAPLEPPDETMRAKLVRRFAAARDATLPEPVTALIASTVAGSVTELRSAFTKVIGYAAVSHRPVDESLAREVLELASPAAPLPRPIRLEEIITEVSQAYAVSIEALKSRSRTRSITFPRQVAMYLSRTLTKHSLEEIGRFFGGRDHSTVKHGFDKIRRLTKDGIELSRIVKTLRKRILNRSG